MVGLIQEMDPMHAGGLDLVLLSRMFFQSDIFGLHCHHMDSKMNM